MWPEGYADKSMQLEQHDAPTGAPSSPESPAVDWRSLYLAERQRADQLAALLKRRHALDPLEVAEVLASFPQEGSPQ